MSFTKLLIGLSKTNFLTTVLYVKVQKALVIILLFWYFSHLFLHRVLNVLYDWATYHFNNFKKDKSLCVKSKHFLDSITDVYRAITNVSDMCIIKPENIRLAFLSLRSTKNNAGTATDFIMYMLFLKNYLPSALGTVKTSLLPEPRVSVSVG